jgi:hypothetical protein
MPRFPIAEAEIAALAALVVEGLEQAVEDFPTPPVPATELRAQLGTYASYQDLSRRYIAELNKPRIRLPAIVGFMGAVGVGLVVGRMIPCNPRLCRRTTGLRPPTRGSDPWTLGIRPWHKGSCPRAADPRRRTTDKCPRASARCPWTTDERTRTSPRCPWPHTHCPRPIGRWTWFPFISQGGSYGKAGEGRRLKPPLGRLTVAKATGESMSLQRQAPRGYGRSSGPAVRRSRARRPRRIHRRARGTPSAARRSPTWPQTGPDSGLAQTTPGSPEHARATGRLRQLPAGPLPPVRKRASPTTHPGCSRRA